MTGPEQMRVERRTGFTLVELLVVMGVILVLMTLAVAFVPRVTEQQRVSRAGSQLQGWLSLAKQWALRDQALRGLRLTYSPPNPANPDDPQVYRVTTLQYIEQPDDWAPGGVANITISNATPAVATLNSGAIDFSGLQFGSLATPPPPSQWPVLVGDFLEFSNGSKMQVAKINALTRTTLTLNIGGLLQAIPAGSFSVVRGARVRTGEAPLQMPPDTAIDVFTGGPIEMFANNHTVYNSPLPVSTNAPFSYDIMFTPFGGVIANGVPGNDLRLWVVDTSLNGPYHFDFRLNPPPPLPIAPPPPVFDGQQLIVTVALRSGLISVHPPDTTLDATGKYYWNPYSYTQDGRTSGF